LTYQFSPDATEMRNAKHIQY